MTRIGRMGADDWGKVEVEVKVEGRKRVTHVFATLRHDGRMGLDFMAEFEGKNVDNGGVGLTI